MAWIARFFGSFYSAAMYRRLRLDATGYGFGYSLFLLVLIAAVSTACLYWYTPANLSVVMPRIDQIPPGQWPLIAAAFLGLRGAMLLALAIAALSIAPRLALPLDRSAAFRLAGVAYTPTAVMDAIALCTTGEAMLPFVLFPCGVVMLLAAMHASR